MMILKNINSVLIVCTGNICRSPMGEGVLKHKLNQAGLSYIQIHSAGTSGWDRCKPISLAIQACSEMGVDISSLRSNPITEKMIQSSDVILAMEKNHLSEMIKLYHAPSQKLFLFGDFHPDLPGMEIEDPYGLPISYYRNILKLICQCSDGFIGLLKKTT